MDDAKRFGGQSDVTTLGRRSYGLRSKGRLQIRFAAQIILVLAGAPSGFSGGRATE